MLDLPSHDGDLPSQSEVLHGGGQVQQDGWLQGHGCTRRVLACWADDIGAWHLDDRALTILVAHDWSVSLATEPPTMERLAERAAVGKLRATEENMLAAGCGK